MNIRDKKRRWAFTVAKTKSLTLTDLSSKPLKPGLLLKVVLIRRNVIRASPSHETTQGNHDLTAMSVEEDDETCEPREKRGRTQKGCISA